MGLYELAVDFVTISDSKNKGSIKLYLITRDIFDYQRKKVLGSYCFKPLKFLQSLKLSAWHLSGSMCNNIIL